MIKRITSKVKVPVVLVVSKSDLLEGKRQGFSCDIQEAMELAKQFKIPLTFTSAHQNINVKETFLLIAKLVQGKKVKGIEHTRIHYEPAYEHHIQISLRLEKEFGILLSSMVENLQGTWSSLLPRLKGRLTFEDYICMFGESRAKSAFQRRVLQLGVAQCNKIWNGADDQSARTRKQEMLKDLLNEHKDFYDFSDLEYESVEFDDSSTLSRSNVYCYDYEARGYTLSRNPVQDTSLVSFGITETDCTTEDWPCLAEHHYEQLETAGILDACAEIPYSSQPSKWSRSQQNKIIYEEVEADYNSSPTDS
jgi:hypothetical protein